jgi:hypothetical protein
MSHLDSKHDRENEYPTDSTPSKKAKSKAIKKFTHPVSKTIKQLEHRKGEAPLAKLKRLLK